MTQHTFETPDPVHLFVEIGKGRVDVTALDTSQSTVVVEGAEAERVLVEHQDQQISVIAPKERLGFLGRDAELRVTVTVPTGSALGIRTGSADLVAVGSFGGGKVRSGSGDLEIDTCTGHLVVESGSGDIAVTRAAAALRIKAGSGDIRVGRCEESTVISAGSGDVTVDEAIAATAVKTGSGDLAIEETHADAILTTGSGDVIVGAARAGRIVAKGASGDIVVGVPSGLPVWTDLFTTSGDVRSDLASVGEPAPGQEHLEIRAKTASGDIVLRQL